MSQLRQGDTERDARGGERTRRGVKDGAENEREGGREGRRVDCSPSYCFNCLWVRGRLTYIRFFVAARAGGEGVCGGGRGGGEGKGER